MTNGGRMLALAGLLMLTAQAAPPAAPVTASDFCARLAADSGIVVPAGQPEWTVNALNFGQRWFFGGSTATGVGVEPIDPVTVEDYKRLEDMCLPDGKGAICKLVGPVNVRFYWKGKKILTPMRASEKATILIKGTKTTCRIGGAAATT